MWRQERREGRTREWASGDDDETAGSRVYYSCYRSLSKEPDCKLTVGLCLDASVIWISCCCRLKPNGYHSSRLWSQATIAWTGVLVVGHRMVDTWSRKQERYLSSRLSPTTIWPVNHKWAKKRSPNAESTITNLEIRNRDSLVVTSFIVSSLRSSQNQKENEIMIGNFLVEARGEHEATKRLWKKIAVASWVADQGKLIPNREWRQTASSLRWW